MVVRGKGGKVIKVPFTVGAGRGCMYLKPFRKWSKVGPTVYCTKQAQKAHTNDLEKGPTKEYYCQLCYTTVRFKVPMVDKRCMGLTQEGPRMMH